MGGGAGVPITPKSLPFYNDYKKMYGEYPIAYTNGVTYDIVMAWAKAVKLAGTVETEPVLKAMERKDLNYEGVCGIIEYFDQIHNPVGGGWKEGEGWGWLHYQWQNEKRVYLWPSKFATGKMIIPDWVKDLLKK